MPTLYLAKITCDSHTRFGGPIELRIPQSSNQPSTWGPQALQVGQSVDFSQLPLPQQLAPTPFFNPIQVELWDSKYSAKVKEIVIKPTNVGSSPPNPPLPPTFSYFGGTYTLNYVVTANAVELLFAYISSSFSLIAAFLIDFVQLTIETARSFLKLIFAPFRRLTPGKHNEESIPEDDSKPLNHDAELIQKRDSEKIQR